MSCYRRIACLSTEAAEVIYALGAQDSIAGISGFTVHPPEARKEKPKISGFSSSRVERILAVQPDLAIAFSDLQADICGELAAHGVEVMLFNQRDVAGILRMVKAVAGLLERTEEGQRLVGQLQAQIDAVRMQAEKFDDGLRPRVYFEEWNDPLISGIGWVSELIGIAGGEDVFAELAAHPGAKGRIIADPMEVVRRAPDIILASWCGKRFRSDAVRARPDWEAIPAVKSGMLFEIKSPDILSPGPSAILHGLPQIAALIARWHAGRRAAQ
jgi:iron complex transport system substrate-binding protein